MLLPDIFGFIFEVIPDIPLESHGASQYTITFSHRYLEGTALVRTLENLSILSLVPYK